MERDIELRDINRINNLRVNKQAIRNLKRNKKSRLRNLKRNIVIGVVAIALASTTAMGISKYKEEQRNQQVQTIVNYYGVESLENKIIEYIKLSKKLNNLNLNKYEIDESLFETYNISNELKSIEEIDELINKCSNINSYISSKDITKQCENINVVLNLYKQEKLVNKFIYNTGYYVAHDNVTDATKKYAGEVLGFENPDDITLKYNSSTPGESSVRIVYNGEKDGTYYYDNWFMTKEEEKIMSGISEMNKTNIDDDFNELDNDKYNKARNYYIQDALEKSVILNTDVNDNDLYNEDMAKKIK